MKRHNPLPFSFAFFASFAFKVYAASCVIAWCLPGGSLAAQADVPEGRGQVRPTPDKHAAGLIASPEPGWPQWRGPRRDGISDEKGLLQSWPEGGPRLLWKITDLGRGWSSPIVTHGSIYITGDVGDDLVVYAYDLEGKPKWQAKNGAAWKGSWPGARACLAASEGRLYHMNAHGRTACLDAGTGREVWAVSVLERFESRNITWAMAECLLVDGPRVIVTPGGPKAMMAALNKRTGETMWASEPVPSDKGGFDKAGYASPLLFEYGGRRHLVSFSSRHAFGVDADAGRLQWAIKYVNPYEVNVCTPIYADGHVFLVAPDDPDATMLRLAVRGDQTRAETAWTCDLDTCTGGGVLVDGVVYGTGYRNFRGWRGVDWKTGKTVSERRDLESGSAVWADGRLWCLGENGTAALLKPVPGGLEICGRFDIATKKRDVWPHPVICDGRLYLRYHETLWCFDVRAR